MKRTRILAALCAILLIVSAASLAAAEAVLPARSSVERAMGFNNNVTVSNKQTLQLYAWPDWSQLLDADGNYVERLLYDTSAMLSATSSASWLPVRELQYLPGFQFSWLDPNASFKQRTGKVTVKGKGFKATIKITQLANAQIVSAVRNKKTVTIKVKPGKNQAHVYRVYRYKLREDGSHGNIGTFVKSGKLSGKKFSFKVAKGYFYRVSFGPALKNEDYYDGYIYSTIAGCEFDVTKVTGKENLIFYNSVN